MDSRVERESEARENPKRTQVRVVSGRRQRAQVKYKAGSEGGKEEETRESRVGLRCSREFGPRRTERRVTVRSNHNHHHYLLLFFLFLLLHLHALLLLHHLLFLLCGNATVQFRDTDQILSKRTRLFC